MGLHQPHTKSLANMKFSDSLCPMRRVPHILTHNARKLRRNATETERILWNLLSPYRPRFTRQLPVGCYIIDMACRQAKLAVELDGGQHSEALAYDTARTVWLEGQGWAVMRVWNNDVLTNADGVADVVLAKVQELTGIVPYRHERWSGD